ncbi:MAG TPA: putative nucleotidyltransferase substrate binding domain-containing protein, partial [Bacteroidales bacterium]|nr:putative nucleotidyltransferase substrate binding domain-containing protein [Bacteroidales bacterium]
TGNEVIDIKKLMLPLVNIVRLYSLKAQLPENNTFMRIAALRDFEILNSADADALSKTYDLLLKLRINNQLRQIFNTYAPDNKIEVAYLTEVELQQLKLSISTIQSFYTRLNFDFKHNIG